LIKKKDLIIFGVVCIPAAIMTINSYRPTWPHVASNFTFGIGFIYLIIGLCIVVRNFGLFKTLGYNRYRRNFKKHGNADPSARPVSFGEYVVDTQRHDPFARYLLVGAGFIALSFLFAYFV